MSRPGTTIGVLGGSWRATVTPWGDVEPDDARALRWWVAADDRWHVPSDEPTVRQRHVDGAPVVETTLRVPSGDAIHRCYAVADGGGLTVVEVENRSPLPFAVAFSHGDLLTSRPPTEVPVHGIELPPTAVVVPVGHRTSVRVAVRHRDPGAGSLPPELPSAVQVARGWVAQAERGARFVLPEHGSDVVRERCRLLLEGAAPPGDEPAAFLVGGRELVRLGDPATDWAEEVGFAVEAVARSCRHRELTWDVDAALDAADEVLRAAGEGRAVGDLDALRRRLGPAGEPPAEPPDGALLLAWVERRLVHRGADAVDLLAGFPSAWLGQGVEVYRLPVGPTTVSFAVRWHGERPAVLWECGAPLRLTCRTLDPTWSTSLVKGEALLGVPPMAAG